MDRVEKESLVISLREIFKDNSMVVITHYSGLTVKEMGDLRSRMREAGALFKVTKNRLTRLALKDTKFEALSAMFRGPTAIAYSDDPVAAAKVAVNYAKENDKLVVLGGGLDEEIFDADGIKSLALLPTLDEIRGKIIGLLDAPGTKLAQVLIAPGGQIARVVSAHADHTE